ncbi:50S ribosomal protein L5 [Paraliomyxa miuraensis]|uniref:50S ribosomal protein L5 n=1 Tax=Paraliomyxa miuraensis TaxID=376150 RepID=UPI0022529FBA|nr:50S ribosomal protein L5 [Paraliomyxa miuraensis]MCX4241289.1 50S ribosomal protein L5 [Paraliomyxa miuraensis]
MAKAQRGAPTQKKKKEIGFPYKFRRLQEKPLRRSESDRPRLLGKYEQNVRPWLLKEFGYKNPFEVPRVEKVVLNIGLGEALKTPKLLEQAFESLGNITGQRPVVTRAKKSIATFKLREGMKIGCMVTLRGPRMWEFLDRLLTVALPRTRDFRGVSRKAFDGRGNYTLGIRELLIFPEVDIEKLDKVPGMNICVHTSAKTDEEGRALLTQLGVPFRAA